MNHRMPRNPHYAEAMRRYCQDPSMPSLRRLAHDMGLNETTLKNWSRRSGWVEVRRRYHSNTSAQAEGIDAAAAAVGELVKGWDSLTEQERMVAVVRLPLECGALALVLLRVAVVLVQAAAKAEKATDARAWMQAVDLAVNRAMAIAPGRVGEKQAGIPEPTEVRTPQDEATVREIRKRLSAPAEEPQDEGEAVEVPVLRERVTSVWAATGGERDEE